MRAHSRPTPPRASLWSAVLLALCSTACSVINSDHCGNQDGHATCLQRDPNAPYCSLCVADNNGCLAAAPPTDCLADTAPATATATAADTTTAPSTSTSDPPTSSTSSTTSTTQPTTTSDTTSTGTDSGDTSTGGTSTTDPLSTTTTGETTSTTSSTTSTTQPTTTSDTTSTGTGSGDTSTGTTSTDDPLTTTTTGETTGTTSTTADTSDTSTTDTTTGAPVCGDNLAEGDEVCDGADLDGETCKTVGPGKWGGGSLGCNACMSLNDTKCCVGLGGACGGLIPDPKLPCCFGLECKLEGITSKCRNPP